MKNVIVLSEPAEDIEAAQGYYDEREPGVDRYFVDSLLDEFSWLATFRGIRSRHFEFHRMIATHFPFGIYYRERGNDILIVAVLNLHRDPDWIRKQLRRGRAP